jgi:hypothetical protein
VIDINIQASGWTAHFALRRTHAEDVMDWKKRAEERSARRKNHVDALKQAKNTRALLMFYLPDCFDSIAKTIQAELAKCGHAISATYNIETMSAEISKDAYPHAFLKVLIQPPTTPESCNALILCSTKGLGINNAAHNTDQRYDISVDDGGNVVYRARGAAGGISSEPLTLPDLVDAILGPFADYIGG